MKELVTCLPDLVRSLPGPPLSPHLIAMSHHCARRIFANAYSTAGPSFESARRREDGSDHRKAARRSSRAGSDPAGQERRTRGQRRSCQTRRSRGRKWLWRGSFTLASSAPCKRVVESSSVWHTYVVPNLLILPHPHRVPSSLEFRPNPSSTPTPRHLE